MKTNMVILMTEHFGVRVFCGDFDRAVDLAHFFSAQRWTTRVTEVQMEEHPRTTDEQELAQALVAAYDAWKKWALPEPK